MAEGSEVKGVFLIVCPFIYSIKQICCGLVLRLGYGQLILYQLLKAKSDQGMKHGKPDALSN